MASILKGIKAALGDVEMPPYSVLVERGGYEEREYPARRWACTSMSGPSRHELVEPMFRKLLNYISGKNEPNVRMDMTAPVVTLVEPGCEEGKTTPTYTMCFLIPCSHQEDPPPTADKSIFIEYRPLMTILSRRFSGYLDDEVVKKEIESLSECIRCNGEADDVDMGRYYVVGYDPPFKLFGRRNEVWFVRVKKKNTDGWIKDGGDGVLSDVGSVDGVVKSSCGDGDCGLVVGDGVVKSDCDVECIPVVSAGGGGGGDGANGVLVKGDPDGVVLGDCKSDCSPVVSGVPGGVELSDCKSDCSTVVSGVPGGVELNDCESDCSTVVSGVPGGVKLSDCESDCMPVNGEV